jgi:hypothetical protein
MSEQLDAHLLHQAQLLARRQTEQMDFEGAVSFSSDTTRTEKLKYLNANASSSFLSSAAAFRK